MSKCTCAFPCGGTTAACPSSPGYGQPTPKYDDTLLPFLALMRKELHANAGKGDREGWLSMQPWECLLELYYHMGKLQKAVKHLNPFSIREYAADVANMAMMLVDICSLLTCSVEGCSNPQPEDVRYAGMCPDCYQKDCEEGMEQAAQMADNMAKYGTIDVPAPAKCQNCGATTGEACHAAGCNHLEAGNGAPAPDLCQDEGCPHHGTDHVCVTPDPLARHHRKAKELLAKLAEKGFIPCEGDSPWTVVDIHDEVEQSLGIDLDMNDIDLFAVLLVEFNALARVNTHEEEPAGPLQTFTVFCREANNAGTTWIGAVEAVDMAQAGELGAEACVADWWREGSDLTVDNIAILGVAEGDVKILEWNDAE